MGLDAEGGEGVLFGLVDRLLDFDHHHLSLLARMVGFQQVDDSCLLLVLNWDVHYLQNLSLDTAGLSPYVTRRDELTK